MTQAPHLLILTSTDDEDDPDFPGYWDTVELRCPFDPPVPAMPCAVFEPCGCEAKRSEIDFIYESGAGPCPHSGTGVHVYIEGEPNKPRAECWAVHHADGLEDAARELDIPLGQYAVVPSSVDDKLQLELVDDDAAEDARRKARNREAAV